MAPLGIVASEEVVAQVPALPVEVGIVIAPSVGLVFNVADEQQAVRAARHSLAVYHEVAGVGLYCQLSLEVARLRRVEPQLHFELLVERRGRRWRYSVERGVALYRVDHEVKAARIVQPHPGHGVPLVAHIGGVEHHLGVEQLGRVLLEVDDVQPEVAQLEAVFAVEHRVATLVERELDVMVAGDAGQERPPRITAAEHCLRAGVGIAEGVGHAAVHRVGYLKRGVVARVACARRAIRVSVPREVADLARGHREVYLQPRRVGRVVGLLRACVVGHVALYDERALRVGRERHALCALGHYLAEVGHIPHKCLQRHLEVAGAGLQRGLSLVGAGLVGPERHLHSQLLKYLGRARGPQHRKRLVVTPHGIDRERGEPLVEERYIGLSLYGVAINDEVAEVYRRRHQLGRVGVGRTALQAQVIDIQVVVVDAGVIVAVILELHIVLARGQFHLAVDGRLGVGIAGIGSVHVVDEHPAGV